MTVHKVNQNDRILKKPDILNFLLHCKQKENLVSCDIYLLLGTSPGLSLAAGNVEGPAAAELGDEDLSEPVRDCSAEDFDLKGNSLL